ncbi:MAG TPA: TonB-dependent receptor [Caulobacteraceae bacterium]|nr:TonB-dependent receptor [Caulobacteraceae bacterium]
MCPRIAYLTAASVLALTAPAAAQQTQVEEVIVTAAPYAVSLDALTGSIDVVSAEDLATGVPGGLGDVLAGMPGLRSTAFGPGASRPVVRGLAGPRVQVLTNGIGMIDASSLSPDHQVASDPSEAHRIEVLRGPAALLYGGSAIGGVVNVIDERIATSRPNGLDGRVTASASSVDDGYALSGDLHAPLGPLVLTLDAAHRASDDYRIPVFPEARRVLEAEGEEPGPAPDTLENTGVDLTAYGAGLSWVADSGSFLGASVKKTESEYGVPGHAHEGEANVTIGLEQTRYDIRGELHRDLGFFDTARLSAGAADYTHTEFEGAEVGTRFMSQGMEARLELVQPKRGGWDGAVGFQGLKRELDAVGEEAYVPASEIAELGAFTMQRLDLGRWGFEGGLRLDRRELESAVASRQFTNVSASGGVFVQPDDWYLGLSVSRTARAPTEAELFADGPHAATRGFEVGDASLDAEVAHSAEFAAHYGQGRLSADLHLYYVAYDGFIDLRPTGGEADGLPVFEYVQTDADFHGFEAEAQYRLTDAVSLEGAADYVRANSDLGPPARIPPWSLAARLVWESGDHAARVELRRVGEQDRVAELELPTDGYTQLNAGYSWSPPAFDGLKLFVEGRNLTDEEAREHASFLKDLAPLPGRNLRAGATWSF